MTIEAILAIQQDRIRRSLYSADRVFVQTKPKVVGISKGQPSPLSEAAKKARQVEARSRRARWRRSRAREAENLKRARTNLLVWRQEGAA